MVTGKFAAILYIAALVGYGIVKGGRARDFKQFTATASEPPTLVVALSMCASFIGGGFSLGNAERAFTSGIANTLLLMGFSLGQVVVALLLSKRFSRYKNVSTAGGIIGKAFGTRARLFCGMLSFIYCAGVLGAQVNAIGTVAGALFGLPPKLCAVVGCVILVVYSTMGGLRASLKSDTVQVAVLAVGLPVVLLLALGKVGGAGALFAQVPSGHLAPLDGYGTVEYIGIFFTFMIGEMLCPPAVQRQLLSRQPERVRRATLISAFVSVPFFVVTGLVGLSALVLGTTDIPAFAMPSLISAVAGFPLAPLLCAAMLCVYLSSGGAFLNSASVSLCSDVVDILRTSPLGDKQKIRAVRGINILCGLAALAVAVMLDNVLSILVLSYSFWAPVILVPLCAALLGYTGKPHQFFLPAAFAAAALLGWRIAGSPLGLSPVVVGFIANLIAFLLLSRKKELQP